MDSRPHNITLNDITGAASYIAFHGIQPTFRKEAGGRIVADVEATEEALRLLAEFQGNPSVPIADFLAVQRRLRGRMLDQRDGDKRIINGHGKSYGNSPR